MDALDAVREFRLRVVVATNLVARGVDLGALHAVTARISGIEKHLCASACGFIAFNCPRPRM